VELPVSQQTREDKASAAKVRMAELAVKFLNRTQADIATMRSGLSRLAAGDMDALGEIRHLAHRMVGTGATLGFEAISERARVVEQLAESCAPGSRPDESCRAALADALHALDAEFANLPTN
jgi:HPt (histidine-containing phosphotransfer) domain-containing protein